jgi:dTDP-4-dehydrorhamnose reductase
MRIVITGRHGQVATSLIERAKLLTGLEAVPVGRPDLDLARPETIAPAIFRARPDLVVSAAAYTGVDQAEDEPALAYSVNAIGAGAVAAAAADAGAPVIHVSTDYVFSGKLDRPYAEDDKTGPQCVYGRTKLEGELAVQAANPRHLILRTAWIYSPFGRNFPKTMLNLAQQRAEISVVADQWGNPTSALDIADGVLHLAKRLGRNWGIYHLAGTGEANWADFARYVLAVSRSLGGPNAAIKEITSADFPSKARRPGNSRLSQAKILEDFGWTSPDWRISAEAVVARILKVPR